MKEEPMPKIDDVCIQEFTLLGCTDSTATNFDANATDDDGTCYFAGCTYPGFDNYDPNADIDNDLCFYYGCMDDGLHDFSYNAFFSPTMISLFFAFILVT